MSAETQFREVGQQNADVETAFLHAHAAKRADAAVTAMKKGLE